MSEQKATPDWRNQALVDWTNRALRAEDATERLTKERDLLRRQLTGRIEDCERYAQEHGEQRAEIERLTRELAAAVLDVARLSSLLEDVTKICKKQRGRAEVAEAARNEARAAIQAVLALPIAKKELKTLDMGIGTKTENSAWLRLREATNWSSPATGSSPSRVRFTPYLGKMDGAEQTRMRQHPLYQSGDTVLVWVNEGDLYTAAAERVAPQNTTSPPKEQP